MALAGGLFSEHSDRFWPIENQKIGRDSLETVSQRSS